MNGQQRSTNPLVPQDGLLDVRVSQNYGYHFEDPYSQDNNILGSILGCPIPGNYRVPKASGVIDCSEKVGHVDLWRSPYTTGCNRFQAY